MKKIFTIIFMFLVMATNAQTKYEMNTIDVINQIRQNPQSVIRYIDSLKSNIPNYFTSDVNKVTNLVECYNETIEFLKTQNPVDTLTFNKEIYNEVSKFDFKGKQSNFEEIAKNIREGYENLHWFESTHSLIDHLRSGVAIWHGTRVMGESLGWHRTANDLLEALLGRIKHKIMPVQSRW